MIRAIQVCIVASLAVLAACGQSAPATYPPQYELNFMRACQAQGATTAVCGCIWERIETEVPPADFAAFERLSAAEQTGHAMQQQIEQFALSCAAPAQAPSP